MPLVIMLTVGIWTTARAWNVHNVLDHAAREAARAGATEVPWDAGSPGSVRTVADRELSPSRVDFASVASCIEKVEGAGDPCGLGDPTTDPRVQVRLTYSGYPLDFVFFRMTVDLQASAVARWEGD